MNKLNIRDIVELIGGLSIVASLVFVGLQLKQSQDVAIAAQYQSRAESLTNLYMELVTSEVTPAPPATSTDGFSEEEIYQRALLLNWFFSAYENNHMQNELGFVDEESWISMENRFRSVLAIDFNREYFRSESQNYRASFVEWALAL